MNLVKWGVYAQFCVHLGLLGMKMYEIHWFNLLIQKASRHLFGRLFQFDV